MTEDGKIWKFTGKLVDQDLSDETVYYRAFDDDYTLVLGLGKDIRGLPSNADVPHHYDALPGHLKQATIDYVSSLHGGQRVDYLWNKVRQRV